MGRLTFIWFFSLFLSFVHSNDPSEVEIEQGRLIGRKMKSVQYGATYYSYRSVPYAEPPVGKLRFQLPEPHTGWEGLFEAKKSKTACAHYIQTYELNPNYYTGDEDCLYLTVHTPAPGTDLKNLPVAVYLYSDFFRSGLAKIERHNPDYFVEEGIIIVVIHHRLSALGFLNLEDDSIPANVGLKDIVLGLQWIKNNIKAFGGDPDSVTLFGISSGAATAEMLLQSEKTKGLFSKIIAHSDSIFNSAYYPRTPRKNAFDLGKRLEKDAVTSRSLIRELLTLDAKDIQQKELYVLNGDAAKEIQTGILPLSPSIEPPSEHALLLKKPEDGLAEIDIPIMTGFCNREGIKYSESYLIRPPLLTYAERDLPFNFPLRNDYRFEPYEMGYLNIIQDIKDFYFEDGKVKVNNMTEMITYLGDLMTGFAINHGVKEYSSHSKAPVYYYVFGFDGELNFAKKRVWGTARTFEGTEGANAGDELCYLFVCSKHRKIYEKLHSLEETPKEIQMIRRMVRLWSNFIKTGNPTPSDDDPILEGFKWQPATPEELHFLNITEEAELVLGKDPRKEFFDFWYSAVDYYRQYVDKEGLFDENAFKLSIPGFDMEADRLAKQKREEERIKIEEESKNAYVQGMPQVQGEEEVDRVMISDELVPDHLKMSEAVPQEKEEL